MKAIPMPKQIKFLSALSVGNSVTKAAKIADVPRRTLYYWKDESPDFAEAWEEALSTSVEELEDEVRARALDREDGKSHILLMFLLKKHRPEYRENYQQKKEVTIHHTKEFDFSEEDRRKAIEILNAAVGPEESTPALDSSDPTAGAEKAAESVSEQDTATGPPSDAAE